jgi:recombination protein RecR
LNSYPPIFAGLVEELSKLPGVGGRTAQRLAFHLLKGSTRNCELLAQNLLELHKKVRTCENCFNLTEQKLCSICSDQRRGLEQICVVEEPRDLEAIENLSQYKGRYHVLMGVLSPLEGTGPESLKIRELLERLKNNSVKEIILAMNPDVEGEATALYLARLLKPLNLKITRLALGLSMGQDLEYADQLTLGRALQNRKEL